MAFLFLLMISLTSMTAVESQVATSTKSSDSARQNALMALNVAIGELQRLTGPDQRITARASMLDSDTETFTDDDVAEPYWTGVWDENGNLLSWLISGNQGLQPNDGDFITPEASNENWIQLTKDDQVHVPLQEIDNGRYAYWIDDEGIKAKTNLKTSGSNQYEKLITAQTPGIAQISNMAWLDEIPDEARTLTQSYSELKILAPDQTAKASLDTNSYDLTTASYGLLTNTRDGGLKLDLTRALFDGDNLPAGQIFGPQISEGTDDDPGGPLWTQLQSWATTLPNDQGELPIIPTTDSQAGFHPVVTQVQFYVVPRVDASVQDTDGYYQVVLDILPAVVLWNPYDRALESKEYRIEIGKGYRNRNNSGTLGNDFEKTFAWWQVRNKDNKHFQYGTNSAKTVFKPDSSPFDASLSFTINSVSLEPGQAVAFSPPAGRTQLDVLSRNTLPAAGQNELQPGYRESACFTIPTETKSELLNPDGFMVAADDIINFGYRFTTIDNELLSQATGMSSEDRVAAPQANLLTTQQADTLGVSSLDGSIGWKIYRNFVDGDDPKVKWISQYNPRAVTQGPTPHTFNSYSNRRDLQNQAHDNNPSLYYEVFKDGEDIAIGLPAIGNDTGVGLNTNEVYVEESILFESPPGRNYLQSIGQLMHAPLYFTNDNNTINKQKLLYRMEYARFDNHMPAYAIGSSQADSRIPLDSTYMQWDNNPPSDLSALYKFDSVHYDHSYLLNEALWDGFFFSTLPNATSREPTNSRIVPHHPIGTNAIAADEVASQFLVDGMFNVNSTSEKAWRALLASFYGESLNATQPEGSPFVRTLFSPGDAFDTELDDFESETAYHGYRTLTQNQITNLARQIVKEVKRRGPFTSLASFVNRDPNHNAPSYQDVDAFRLQGTLAAAIKAADELTLEEATELDIPQESSKINAALKSSYIEAIPRADHGFIEKAEEGWRTEGIPGWLTQADLLARLGPVLNARSDTFRIVAYGETRNPLTGKIEGQAWAEAFIQRLPEFLDISDAPNTPLSDLTKQENITHGRRYEIVGFRWIENPDNQL